MFNSRRKARKFLRRSWTLLLWTSFLFKIVFLATSYIATYGEQRSENNYDTESNWDNLCHKRKIKTTYYPDYDKEPQKDPD